MVNFALIESYLSSGLACCVYQMTSDDLDYLRVVNYSMYELAMNELRSDK